MKQSKSSLMFMILVLPLLICGTQGDTAPAKAPKKNPVSTRKNSDIPRTRVVKEFSDAYQSPPGSAVKKIYHTGKSRRGTRMRGGTRIPVQVHMIALEVRLIDCDIALRDIWEVYFYYLEREWVFDGILQISSKQLTRPRKKHPDLDAAATKKLIADGVAGQYPGTRTKDVTVLSKKPDWKLCTPQYRVKSKLLVQHADDVYNTTATYECLMTSVLSYRGGTWVYDTSGCVYRGAEVSECHIGTMCRALSGESSLPAVSDDQARALLRSAFENEYGLKKNRVAVESFLIIGRRPPENFGRRIPCVMRALFVIDEIKETAVAARIAIPVRAAYECVVFGALIYSADEGRWTGVIDSCCSSESNQCGDSCSAPVKGCRRLGEK
ncbi:MAG: hypothetical protein JXA07_09310 [Spirochaetes bacterium]|nr:hypothetical protein [Spirochaetota bacterium]